MSDDVTVAERVDRLALRARDAIPGCEVVGVSVARRGLLETRAATGDLARELDACQHLAGEGPCLDAFYSEGVYRTGDLWADERWPRFSLLTRDLDVRSMLSYRLFTEADSLGSLNVYSSRQHAFSDEAMVLGAIFAAHAAVALARAQEHEEAENLQRALESNRMIGTAVGILMATQRLSAEDALERLSRASQRTNTKLKVLAEQVVLTGRLPE
ncbi:MAG: ANTAR domain-containing protein [Frankiales bacterium]|nr:ANTAR domain-containing protein [Frankiales bacterium]